MTIKMNAKTIKDKLKDETLDLSLSDLKEVPVREIALVKKATHLDLSSNLLVTLPKNFVMLNHLVKLDLSRNMLTEIPENFGEMRQLRHLDLYANQISRLPLSLGELKQLRWLDLKENPLTPAVASVAGACSDMAECQFCARNVVAFLSSLKQSIEEEKQRRLNSITEAAEKERPVKKEGKKKKKKAAEKENKKNTEKNGTPLQQKQSEETGENNVDVVTEHEEVTDIKNVEKPCSSKGAALYRVVKRIIVLLYLVIFTSMLFIAVLPLYDKQLSSKILDYVEDRVNVGPILRNYQQRSTDVLRIFIETATAWTHRLYGALNRLYRGIDEVNIP